MAAILSQPQYVNFSGTETRLFWENQNNTNCPHALDQNFASAVMVLTTIKALI